jgi:hypothetical protein
MTRRFGSPERFGRGQRFVPAKERIHAGRFIWRRESTFTPVRGGNGCRRFSRIAALCTRSERGLAPGLNVSTALGTSRSATIFLWPHAATLTSRARVSHERSLGSPYRTIWLHCGCCACCVCADPGPQSVKKSRPVMSEPEPQNAIKSCVR